MSSDDSSSMSTDDDVSMGLFDKLADETMLVIFKYLNIHNLMVIRDCSKKWKRLTGDRSLYNYVEIDMRSNDIDKLMEMITHSGSAVKTLKLSLLDGFEKYQPCIPLCPNVESLMIYSCEYENATRDVETELLDMLKQKTNLKRFAVNNSGCITRLNTLVNILSGYRLEVLNISYESGLITMKTLNKLRVNELKLKFVQVAIRPGISTFCQNNAENLTSLKLCIDRCKNWDPNDNILKPLKQCVNLKILILGNKVAEHVKDSGLAHLHDLKLKTFEIWHAGRISVNGFVEFFDNMPLLRKIGLCYCPAVNAVVLRKIVQACKELRRFKFWKCPNRGFSFDPSDLMIIAKGAREIRKLELWFVGPKIGRILHTLPKIMPNLQEIVYWGMAYSKKRRTAFLDRLAEKIEPFFVLVEDVSSSMLLLRCVRSHVQLESNSPVCRDCVGAGKKSIHH